MTIQIQVYSEEVFLEKLYSFLRKFEGANHTKPTLVCGRPTVGIGFDLRNENNRKKIFSVMGITDKLKINDLTNNRFVGLNTNSRSSLPASCRYSS